MGFPMIQGEELDGDLQFRVCLCTTLAVGLCTSSHLLPEEASLMTLDKAPSLSAVGYGESVASVYCMGEESIFHKKEKNSIFCLF